MDKDKMPRTAKDWNITLLTTGAFGWLIGIAVLRVLPPIGAVVAEPILIGLVIIGSIYTIRRGRQLKRENKLNAEKVKV